MDPMTGKMTGKAWGADVVGWLDFNVQIATVPLSGSCTGVAANGVATFTAHASGGSGEYQYDWSDARGWVSGTTDFSKTKAYTDAGTVTQALNIRDKNNTTSTVIPSPICSTGVASPTPTPTYGGVIGQPGSCTITADASTPLYLVNGVNTVFIDQTTRIAKLVFTVNPNKITGGTGPKSSYTYSWYTGNGTYPITGPAGATTWTNIYSASKTNYMTRVKIFDAGSPQASGYAQCGYVNVIATPLSLYIGANGSSAALQGADQEYVIRKGAPFGLKWDNA